MTYAAETYDEQGLKEEALANFAALADDADYAGVLNLLGLGKFQFLRRKQMRAELVGLRIALWRLALARSFPNHAETMFDEFLRRYAASHPDKWGSLTVERAREYWGMLLPGGDSDFSIAARHLTSFLDLDAEAARALTLKLVLYLRNEYRFIFERLI